MYDVCLLLAAGDIQKNNIAYLFALLLKHVCASSEAFYQSSQNTIRLAQLSPVDFRGFRGSSELDGRLGSCSDCLQLFACNKLDHGSHDNYLILRTSVDFGWESLIWL